MISIRYLVSGIRYHLHKMFSNDQISRYYDVSRSQYEWAWQLKKSRSLHYGYWDASTKNLHEALMNINAKLAGLAVIKATDKVLDAGCGIGGSSLWMGKNIGCTVMGISLNANQVATANGLAQKEGLAGYVHFEKRDFTSTGFPDACFDVVWAIESVCHAADKNDFIKEAWRVLKPGGRLIMADFFQQPGLTGTDERMMRDWAHGWACDHFIGISKFESLLKAAGFKDLQLHDSTDAIRTSARRIYLAYFPGVLTGFLYNLFYPKVTEYGMKNIVTAKLQYKTLQKKLWQYYIVLAGKP